MKTLNYNPNIIHVILHFYLVKWCFNKNYNTIKICFSRFKIYYMCSEMDEFAIWRKEFYFIWLKNVPKWTVFEPLFQVLQTVMQVKLWFCMMAMQKSLKSVRIMVLFHIFKETSDIFQTIIDHFVLNWATGIKLSVFNFRDKIHVPVHSSRNNVQVLWKN